MPRKTNPSADAGQPERVGKRIQEMRERKAKEELERKAKEEIERQEKEELERQQKEEHKNRQPIPYYYRKNGKLEKAESESDKFSAKLIKAEILTNQLSEMMSELKQTKPDDLEKQLMIAAKAQRLQMEIDDLKNPTFSWSGNPEQQLKYRQEMLMRTERALEADSNLVACIKPKKALDDRLKNRQLLNLTPQQIAWSETKIQEMTKQIEEFAYLSLRELCSFPTADSFGVRLEGSVETQIFAMVSIMKDAVGARMDNMRNVNEPLDTDIDLLLKNVGKEMHTLMYALGDPAMMNPDDAEAGAAVRPPTLPVGMDAHMQRMREVLSRRGDSDSGDSLAEAATSSLREMLLEGASEGLAKTHRASNPILSPAARRSASPLPHVEWEPDEPMVISRFRGNRPRPQEQKIRWSLNVMKVIQYNGKTAERIKQVHQLDPSGPPLFQQIETFVPWFDWSSLSSRSTMTDNLNWTKSYGILTDEMDCRDDVNEFGKVLQSNTAVKNCVFSVYPTSEGGSDRLKR